MTGASLKRTTFKTSRLAEFCCQKELINQSGHDIEQWPLVVLKELVDNSIDGCEEAGTAPVIGVSKVVEAALQASTEDDIALPDDLAEQVRNRLSDSNLRWIETVAKVASKR